MYLTVDEQSTYIDVYMDGAVARFHTDGSDAYIGEILDPNNLATAWARFGSRVDVGGTLYAISEDTGITVTLKENTPLKVVIHVGGDFETSAQASLTNEADSEIYFTIYCDKIIQHVKFNASASITLADSTDNGMCFMDSVVANIANEDSKYESSGTETDAASDGEQNAADYIATLSDEINITGILINESAIGSATFGQYIDDAGVSLAFEWNDGTITALSTMTVAWLIDAADRQNDGGTFLDWSPLTAYVAGQIVKNGDLRYFCHTDHSAVAIIDDDFASDSSADYTAINGGIGISGGNAGGTTNWQNNMVWHETSLASADQVVQAYLETGSGSNLDSSGILFRVHDTNETGYIARLNSNDIVLSRFSGTSFIWIAESDLGTVTPGVDYLVKAKIEGTSIIVYVDGVEEINTTDSTYSTGNYCGLSLNRGSANSDVRADDFAGWPASLDPSNALYWHEYRMALGDQYKDLVMAAPSTGSEVTDLVIPFDLSSDGFAADGARHLEMVAAELAFTADRARIGHTTVIHDPLITTDGETDLRIMHLKLDQAYNTSKFRDEITGANIGSGANSGCTFQPGRQGNGVLFDANTEYLSLSAAEQTTLGISYNKGTVALWFRPDSAQSKRKYLFHNYSSGRGIRLYDDYATLKLAIYDDSTLRMSHDVSGFTTVIGQWYHIQLAWDLSTAFSMMAVNGKVLSTQYYATTYGTAITLETLYIGNQDDDDTEHIDGMLDNLTWYSEPMLPYGAIFTGNGSVDTDLAHSDLDFLWNGSDTTPIGSNVTSNGDYTQDGPIGTNAFRNDAAGEYATAVTSGNISAAEGSLQFWFKPNAALGADCTLFYADAAFKVWWDDSDNDVVFTYNTDVLNMTTAFSAGDTNWHHVRCEWDASNELHIIIDGIRTSLLTGVDAAPSLDTNMYFTADDASGTNRANVMISDLSITSVFGTPQIPVILGAGPIYAPIKDIQ